MHHLSLFLSQLAPLPGGKASAPPKIQQARVNKEKLFCGFSSSHDWWSHSLSGEAAGAADAPWQSHPMTSSGPCPCPPQGFPKHLWGGS